MNGDLLTCFKRLEGSDDRIMQCWTYSATTTACCKIPKDHMFVVFQTERWWYSLDKSLTHITMQRGESEILVRDKYRGSDRKDCKRQEGPIESYKSFNFFIDKLNAYDIVRHNCTDFARHCLNWLGPIQYSDYF